MAMEEQLEALLASYEGPPLADALVQLVVPCAPVLGVDAALQDPHTRHTGRWWSSGRRLSRDRVADQAEPHAGELSPGAAH
jgi:crotonobetainyl-CoA:carnitine CoA-transferase CaiB-like acyl-CoA transferase